MNIDGEEMSRLEALADKYGTDKFQHGYIPFYEKYLPKEPTRILEVGVKEGRSLAMWAEYFPNAEIHGLDLFAENNIWDVAEFMKLPYDDYKGDRSRIKFHIGNQCDWLVLEQLRKLDFDVIIDDGSHNSRDQLMTFFGLYNGNHYFIEDLHCCRESFYNQGLPYVATADYLFGSVLPIGHDHLTIHKGDNIALIKGVENV